MRGYFTVAVLFCGGMSIWALTEGREFWSAFWALLAVVNTFSFRQNQMHVEAE